MKKLAMILSLVLITAVFFSSCATIETRYTGKRIPVDPAEYEYRGSDSNAYYPYDYYYDPYYDPYYTSFYGPSFGIGFSFWNPFWYYGLIGSYYWGYYPYYWGYYPYYYGSSGYYPYYYGNRGYYPYYRRSGYYPYKSTYRMYIRKDQLSRGRSYRSPTVRTKSSVRRSGSTSAIRSRSMTPTRSRTTVTRTRTTSSRGVVKKKK